MKRLPYTTKAIQEGRIDPEQFAVRLIDIVFEEENLEDPDIFFMPPFSELLMHPYKHFGHFITSYALPAEFFRQANVAVAAGSSPVASHELRMKVHHELSNAIIENSEKLLSQDGLEKATRRACVVCADGIDRDLFNGNRGCFLRLCPLLKRSNKFWDYAEKGKCRSGKGSSNYPS